jgi:TctA family transporter
VLENLALGAATALSLTNLAYALLGCFLGTLIGVLPGIGPLSTVAILLPITFALEPSTALIMLAAIYYGSQYGGSTTAILLNLPGETSSVVTCLDGHALARKGRAGPALAIAALSSFLAGCVATIIIAGFAPVLAQVALEFSSAEYFSLMVAGLCTAVALSSGPIVKSLAMIVIGLLLGLVGTDVNSGVHRFTFGVTELFDGLDIVALTVGLFALGEIASGLEEPERRTLVDSKIKTIMPTWNDIKTAFLPAVRGTALGSILGILPGGGALISSFAAYSLERQIGKNPETFGKGRIEGVAGPEAANNAGAQTSFIPMLTLGIPGNALIALLLGALIIHGVQPGPRFMVMHPDIFWGVIVSMWVGNLMLVVLNLPLIGIWVKLLQVPFHALFPGIVLLCCVGIYGSGFSVVDVMIAAGFGMVGFVLRKLNCEPVPMVMGFVLGPLMEENFRRTLTLSRGDTSVFFTRPLSLSLLVLGAAVLFLAMQPRIRKSRERYLQEDA